MHRTLLWRLEFHIRLDRKTETQVRTINSNSRTTNCQCTPFKKKMQLSGFSVYPDGSSSQLIGISGVLLHSACLLCEYPVGQISSVAISTCIFAKTDRAKFCSNLSKEEQVIETKLPSIQNTFSTHWHYRVPATYTIFPRYPPSIFYSFCFVTEFILKEVCVTEPHKWRVCSSTTQNKGVQQHHTKEMCAEAPHKIWVYSSTTQNKGVQQHHTKEVCAAAPHKNTTSLSTST